MRGQTCRELTVISLQTALSREKFLEDKLLMFKSILTKHSEDTDSSSLINDLQFALQLKVNKSQESLPFKSAIPCSGGRYWTDHIQKPTRGEEAGPADEGEQGAGAEVEGGRHQTEVQGDPLRQPPVEGLRRRCSDQ